MKQLVAFFFIALASCTEIKTTNDSELSQHVFMVDLIKDSVKMQEYFEHHEKVWPEVEAGFKKAGYKEIKLYRYNNHLVMTISVPKGADLDSIGKIAASYDPKCAEWNQLMDQYQQGVEGTGPNQKWVETDLYYSFPK